MLEWPVPAGDTGIGVHDNPDAYEKPADPVGFAEDLWNRGVRWYLAWIFDENKADFIYQLRRRGIEVMVRPGPAHMPRPMIDMASQVQAYIDVGVNYFVLGNEYNLFEEWNTEDNWKGFDKPLRHQAEWYVRVAREVSNRGAWPFTPPPSLGGHMLHREWFSRFMWAIHNMADEQRVPMIDLLQPNGRGGIGLHCRSVGNPLEAGPDWYDCSAREWEWFAACVKSHVGKWLPMANPEAFDEPQWCRPMLGSHYNWNLWKDRNIQQFRWFDPDNESYRYPPEVLFNAFWVISAHRLSPWPQCALIGNYIHYIQRGDYMTDLWKAMPGVITWERDENVTPPPPPPPPDVQLRVYDAWGTKRNLAWAQEKYGVKLEQFQGKGWHVSQMRERVGAAAGMKMFFYDEHGSPAYGLPVEFHWPGGCDCDKITEVDGKVGFAYGSGAWISDPAVGGPHWIVVEDADADELGGLGMLGGTNHDHLDFVWKYGMLEGTTPPDPLGVIMPLAEGKLGAMPVPADWAFPKAASEQGFEYQVGGYDQVIVGTETWAFQTFTNDDQSEYGVAYSKEGDWSNVQWAIIERN